jgi:hypothetical protein
MNKADQDKLDLIEIDNLLQKRRQIKQQNESHNYNQSMYVRAHTVTPFPPFSGKVERGKYLIFCG